MRPKRREFLKLGTTLLFNKNNGYIIEKYINNSIFPERNQKYLLYFDYSVSPFPNQMKVSLTYLDSNKIVGTKQIIEYVEDSKLLFQKDNKSGRKEKSIPIFYEVGTKKLWKIKFEVKYGMDSRLYLPSI